MYYNPKIIPEFPLKEWVDGFKIFDFNKDIIIDESEYQAIKNTQLFKIISDYKIEKWVKYEIYLTFNKLYKAKNTDKFFVIKNTAEICKTLKKIESYNKQYKKAIDNIVT